MARLCDATDEYPNFQDADVLVLSTTGKTWKLHSRILANGSPVLKDIFAKNAPARIRREDKQEGNLIQWKLQMINHHSAVLADPNVTHYAEFMAVDPHRKQPMSFGIFNAIGDPPKLDTIYNNIFRVFYNLSPDFTPINKSENDEAAPMYEALNLLTAAGYLKAYPAVRLIVESFLMGFNQLLWYEVEHKPEVWASVACKLQSAAMFREAMIHLAGRYHLKGSDGVKQHLLGNVEWGAAILERTKQKGRELKDYKLQTERHLFEFVPERMIHEAKTQIGGIVAPGRAIYANDVYWWMALHLNQHHRAADGGIAFYRTVACPHSYLLDDSLEAFHTMFAMTPKSRVVFVHALNELKKDVSPVVAGLLVNHSKCQKPPDAAPYKYLTCTVLLDEELPWMEKTAIVEANASTAVLEGGRNENLQTIMGPDDRTIPNKSFGSVIPSIGASDPLLFCDQPDSHPKNSGQSPHRQTGHSMSIATPSKTAKISSDQRDVIIAEDEVSETDDWSASATRAAARRRVPPSVYSCSSRSEASPVTKSSNGTSKISTKDKLIRSILTPNVVSSIAVGKTNNTGATCANHVHHVESSLTSVLTSLRRQVRPLKETSFTPPAKKLKTMSVKGSILTTAPKPTRVCTRDSTAESVINQTSKLSKSNISPLNPACLSPFNSANSCARLAGVPDIAMNSKTAHVLGGALALDLLPEDQRKEINAKAQQAHAKGVPNMQGLLEKTYGKTDREGLNMKFRAFVETGMLVCGKTGGSESAYAADKQIKAAIAKGKIPTAKEN